MNTTWQQAPQQHARKPVTGVLLALAAVLALAWALAPRIPLHVNGASINMAQAHAVCVSLIGSIAQALSQRAADDCGAIATVYDLRNIAGIGAVACGIGAAVMAWRAGSKVFGWTAGTLAVLAAAVLLIPAPALTASTSASADSAAAPSASTAALAPAPSADLGTTAPAPSAVPSGPCQAVGGQLINDGATCSEIAYLGSDAQTYYTGAGVNPDGTLQGPAGTAGTGATEQECAAGYYPDGSAGPIYAARGKWDAQLGLCQP